jgi:hypothetical protein
MFTKLSRFASSFVALLSDAETAIDVDSRLTEIKDAMLTSLLEHVSNESTLPKIFLDVRRASEVQTLWYLRSDFFRFLSASCGEQVAQKKIGDITEMFRGIIPHNQMPNRRRTER